MFPSTPRTQAEKERYLTPFSALFSPRTQAEKERYLTPFSAVRGPTAYAVGYFLAPLRGSSSSRVFRLTLMGQRPGW